MTYYDYSELSLDLAVDKNAVCMSTIKKEQTHKDRLILKNWRVSSNDLPFVIDQGTLGGDSYEKIIFTFYLSARAEEGGEIDSDD